MAKSAQPASPRALDRNGSQTLFSQLEEIIREAIESGRWTPGQAIPSERELASMHHLSRMTARRALDRLVAAGLLYRVDGKGTFVSEPKVSFKALSLSGLREQALQMGHSTSSRLLNIQKLFVPAKIGQVLNLAPDAPVYLIERVILSNEMPLGLNRSYIPFELCPDLREEDLANQSLYTLLKTKYGIQIRHATETLETALATSWEALVLNIHPGDPMLLLRITVFDGDDRPIEYVKVTFRGDRVQLHVNA